MKDIEPDDPRLIALQSYLSDDASQEVEDLQRAWDEVIETWEQPDAFSKLQTIVERVNEGEFGGAGQLIGPLTVVRMWAIDHNATRELRELRNLLKTSN